MNVIMISGSRNPQGQTARAAGAILEGAESGGASVESVFLPTLVIKRCRQCKDDGWGTCREQGHCVIRDGFATTVDALRAADAVVFATPVYFSDLSESLKTFLDRLRRTCMHEDGLVGLEGKPTVGVCVAGGGGGGAPECCVNLGKVLSTCRFDVLDLIPVRRQNLEAKLSGLRASGQWLASRD